MADIKAELEELKYQYEKALRVKASLEKNYERRKKLNLLGNDEEYTIKDEIAELTSQADDLRRQMRSLESQFSRSRVIAETRESAPWEQ